MRKSALVFSSGAPAGASLRLRCRAARAAAVAAALGGGGLAAAGAARDAGICGRTSGPVRDSGLKRCTTHGVVAEEGTCWK